MVARRRSQRPRRGGETLAVVSAAVAAGEGTAAGAAGAGVQAVVIFAGGAVAAALAVGVVEVAVVGVEEVVGVVPVVEIFEEAAAVVVKDAVVGEAEGAGAEALANDSIPSRWTLHGCTCGLNRTAQVWAGASRRASASRTDRIPFFSSQAHTPSALP